jgi:hypothetical protein
MDTNPTGYKIYRVGVVGRSRYEQARVDDAKIVMKTHWVK